MEEYLYADMSLSKIYAKLSKSKKSMIMKSNPFPSQLSLLKKNKLAKAPLYGPADNGFSNGSTPENFIAPGGEWYFTEEARRIFLDAAGGDAETAQMLMQQQLDQHNALYLKDRQPRGIEGWTLPVPKQKLDPEDKTADKRGVDPTTLISEKNRKKDWPVQERDGGSQDQANARMDKGNEEDLPKSMEQFTVPHEVTNPEPLQNSFANQDAFNGISLHDLYNRLSKASVNDVNSSSDSNGRDFWNPRFGLPRFVMAEKPANLGISIMSLLPSPKEIDDWNERVVPEKDLEMREKLQRQEMTGDSGETAESANAFIPEMVGQYNRSKKMDSYRSMTRNFMSDAMHSLGPVYNQAIASATALHILNEHLPETYQRLASDDQFVRGANDHVAQMASMGKTDALSVGRHFRQWVREQGREFDATGKMDSFADEQRDIIENLRQPSYKRNPSMPVTHPFFEWYKSKVPNNPVVMALSSAILGEGHPGIQSAHDAFLRTPNISTITKRRGMSPEEGPTKDMGQAAPPPEAPLRNSFYDDIPLHEIYNRLSKANKTPAWQRKEGQNPKGGLNAKGRASAKAEGHNLKPPVKSGDNPRRASFLARMGNSPGPEYDEHGKPTRLLLSLQAWGASSKADARRKAKAISARLKMSKAGMERLEKGRGEDARNRFNNNADQYDEKNYPTGKMIHVSGPSSRAGLGGRYRGVFGENRQLLVEASSRKKKTSSEWYAEPADMAFDPQRSPVPPPVDPHIEWIHIKPGTVVTPHHTQQVFHSLYNAGFTGPNLTYIAIPDDDEVHLTTPLRRDRLFRPWVEKWKKFVASQPPAPYIDTTQPAGDRQYEAWEGLFDEPEVNLERELDRWNENFRRSWFSVSIRRFE